MLGGASAADLGTPATSNVAAAPAPATPYFDWAGPYIGLSGGYAWGDADASFPGSNVLSPNDHSPDGGFVGGQAGWNFVFNNGLMLGVEGDIAAAKLHDQASGDSPFGLTTTDVDVNALGSIKGRVGWEMGQWLPYLTAGWGWANVDRDYANGVLGTASDSSWQNGWTAGFGAEYALNQHWSLKAEYQYYDLGKSNFDVPAPADEGVDADLKIHTLKFGVNLGF
jgi:opacity protein-like surface antigen